MQGCRLPHRLLPPVATAAVADATLAKPAAPEPSVALAAATVAADHVAALAAAGDLLNDLLLAWRVSRRDLLEPQLL